MNLQDHIRIVPNFPKEGINFYDISTLLKHPAAWRLAVSRLCTMAEAYQPDLIMGIESRGFLVAAPMAHEMGIGFGMIRKKGKLPGATLSHKYSLEYGEDEIEIQPDLVPAGARVVIVDDLLATGGTMHASEELIHKSGAKVIANLAIIELEGLDGRAKLNSSFEALLNCPA
ncbi:MAG: adenine phosphoribosyltransferase [Micavibrio sp. TMED27]|nr:adenine phosphoribosyltransferase [Micavibrio sp.]OUT90416.1 MAG: adenine phosphoribosyltransferase [Micavibrio sp. TMED27]|tara:strand:- start:954 stop:1469 length:516 start_codon:yes stop_codon:yes gene_type:complete